MNYDALLFGNGLTLNLLYQLKPYIPENKHYLFFINTFLQHWINGNLTPREENRIYSAKLATTSSTGGLSLALQRAIVTARPKGRYRKHFCWPAIKRYYSNLLVSILLLALLYTFELLHLLYCQSFQHNIL